MNVAPCCMLLLILLVASSTAALPRCRCPAPQHLRLRSSSNELTSDELAQQPEQLEQLDLSQLSESQLQQLMQQLNLAEDYEEDNRGSSRPWKKVQRIIRRQLVRIPKRYLKKLLRQFGLARSGSNRSGSLSRGSMVADEVVPEPQLYYLIPLE